MEKMIVMDLENNEHELPLEALKTIYETMEENHFALLLDKWQKRKEVASEVTTVPKKKAKKKKTTKKKAAKK